MQTVRQERRKEELKLPVGFFQLRKSTEEAFSTFDTPLNGITVQPALLDAVEAAAETFLPYSIKIPHFLGTANFWLLFSLCEV